MKSFKEWIGVFNREQNDSFVEAGVKLTREIVAAARQKHWQRCGNEVFYKIPKLVEDQLLEVSIKLQFPAMGEEWKKAVNEKIQHIFKGIQDIFQPDNLTDGNSRFSHHECSGKSVAFQIMSALSKLRNQFMNGQDQQPDGGQ